MASSSTLSPIEFKRSSSSRALLNKQVRGLTNDEVQQKLLDLLPDHEEWLKENVLEPLCLTDEDYRAVYDLLYKELTKGLSKEEHEEASVRMYPTYVREVPDGTEQGMYLVLDFHGAHFRTLLVNIDSGTISNESKNGMIPNSMLNEHGTKLFDHIAATMHRFLKQNDMLNTAEPIPMAMTFSFHCRMMSLTKAILIKWSKNFHCDGVEGQDVVTMLMDAVKRKGEMNLQCEAVINDTVGTLMTGALTDQKCAIGLVLSHGANVCYMESLENIEKWDGDMEEPKQVIINTEWNSFGKGGSLDFIRTEFDKELDEHSKHPGHATFEKMVGGLYLGEIVRLVMEKLKDCDALFQEHWTEELGTRGRFYTKYVSEVLSEEDIRFTNTRHVYSDLHLEQASEMECRILHHVCHIVSVRAANLVALGVACLLNRMGRKEVGIAVDGALFRFHPMFKKLLEERIPHFLKQDTKFWFVQAADRSGNGAAIAAAVAERLEKKKEQPVIEPNT